MGPVVDELCKEDSVLRDFWKQFEKLQQGKEWLQGRVEK
jgi:hypothetical protein